MGNDEHGPAYPETSPNYIVSICEYRCPICKGNENRFMECEYPMCPDGRDQRRFDRPRDPAPSATRVKCTSCAVFSALLIGALLGALALFGITHAFGMDHGFDPNDKTVQWMERLQRPNMPGSCCGKGDAYPVSSYWDNKDGTWTAVIRDGSGITYPDGTVRNYIASGTEVSVDEVLVNKLDDDLDNPTDTSWIFMTVHAAEVGTVYCLIRHPEGN